MLLIAVLNEEVYGIYHIMVCDVAVFDPQDLRTSHVGLRQINGFSSLLSVFNNENSPSACPSPYSHYDANAKEPHHNSFSNVVSVFSVMPSHILATCSCVCKVKMKDKDSECQEQAKRSSTSQANCTYFHVSKSKPLSWITEPFDSRLPMQLA